MATTAALPRGMTHDSQTGGYRIVRQVDGRRIYRRASTRTEADAIHAQLFGSRTAVRTTRAKLSPYVRDYIVEAVDLRPSSRRSFMSLWRNYIAPSAIANRPLAELEDFELDDFLDDLSRQTGTRTGRRLSSATVGQVRKLLSLVMNHAERKRHIDRNPIRLVQGPAVHHRRVTPPTVDQVRRILAELEGRPDHAAYVLAAYTGMRSGEVFGLRWQDVDLRRRSLIVRGTIDAKTLLWMPTTKTDDSARTIALPPTVVLALQALAASSRPTRRAFPADLVFVTSTGGAVSPSNANKRVQRAAIGAGVTVERRASGLADLTFHTMRHAFTTALREAGVDVEDVSKSIGHASTKMTGHYSHMTDRRRLAVADAAEAIFAGELAGG